MTMTLIETKTLGSTQAAIEFTSIPSDGTDLLMLVSPRFSTANADEPIRININGSSSDFTHRILYGFPTSVGSQAPTTYFGWANTTANTSDTFSNIAIYFPNYAGSTNKSFSAESVQEANTTSVGLTIGAGLWSQTTAINSITFYGTNGASLVSGSTISLYKITKGTDGIVIVS